MLPALQTPKRAMGRALKPKELVVLVQALPPSQGELPSVAFTIQVLFETPSPSPALGI